ncbi:Surface polysaccharide O-acyltransferase, integral membrane enzyme [Lachnospiraceae bacterium XBB2008]|nr:Surface polysaccharide O-acyltransferase, integral membrane enzyme [Lachnospiraceae bacterium XBB2008]
MTDKRLYNMDLERVLLIFLVIVLHFNNRDMGGALGTMGVGVACEIFVRMTQSLAICAVDAFIISAGYFSARKSEMTARSSSDATSGPHRDVSSMIPWRKAVWLLATCSFYRVTGYLIYSLLITHDFSVRVFCGYVIPNNWFVCLFVTLLLISPFIQKIPAGVLIILFSVVPTAVSFANDLGGVNLNGLSTVTWQGDMNGFNIGLFICCYCIGYALRVHRNYWDRFSPWFYLVMYILGAALSAALSRLTESAWNYSCVTVVFTAVMLTLFFTRISIKSETAGRIISAVSGCSLGIFVWHTMPLMFIGLWSRFDISEAAGTSRMIPVFFGATIAMYALSFVWTYVCRLVSRPLYARFVRKTG